MRMIGFISSAALLLAGCVNEYELNENLYESNAVEAMSGHDSAIIMMQRLAASSEDIREACEVRVGLNDLHDRRLEEMGRPALSRSPNREYADRICASVQMSN